MPSIKKRPIRLNLDDDERLLGDMDMRYALNVNTTESTGNDNGVLENSKGMTEITVPALPAGENRCIGSISHAQSNNLFFFVWNANGNHCIYYLNEQNKVVYKVMQSSELRFKKNSYVSGEAYQGRSANDLLLYFTDNINPPRKINVRKSVEGVYTTINEEVLSVVKYAPTQEPKWSYSADPSLPYNNIYNKAFQFRYRYIYDDAEVSPYSYASTLTFNDKQIVSTLKALGSAGIFVEDNNIDPYNDLNVLNVVVKSGSNLARKIEVIAREGNVGEWRIIKTLKNNPDAGEQTFEFRNDGAYPVADPQETNKLFDNVPLQARTLAIVENRLFYGNYVDGYDMNVDIDLLSENQESITLRPAAADVDISLLDTLPAVTAVKTSGNSVQPVVCEAEYDYSVFEGLVKQRDILVFKMQITGLDYLVFETIVCDARQSGESSFDYLNRQLNRLIANVGGSRSLSVRNDPTGQITSLRRNIFVSSSNKINVIYEFGGITSIFFSSDARYQGSGLYPSSLFGPSFKKGSRYSLGIVEYDAQMRVSTVNTFPDNDVYVPFFSEGAPRAGDMKGPVRIDYRIEDSIIPSERSRYWSWVVTENTNVGAFTQYSATQAYEPSGNLAQRSQNTVYLNLRGLQGNETSYKEQFGASTEYNFQEGDRLRIISYIDGSGNRVMQSGYLDFRIVSGQIYGPDDSPIYNSTNADTIAKTTGYIIGIDNKGLEDWDGTADSIWNRAGGSVIFEVYRDKPQVDSEQQVYYEVGGIQDVVSAGTNDRIFDGHLRGQKTGATYTIDTWSNFSQPFISSAPNVTFFDAFLGIDEESVDYVVGDKLNLKRGSDLLFVAEVVDIQIVSNKPRLYLKILSTIADTVDPPTSVELAQLAAAGSIVDGDVWFKPRLIRNDNNTASQSFIVFPVEDYSLSDFFPSRGWSKGRANAFVENAREVRRFSTITYSQPYFNETDFNGFSSFDLALANFEQYTQSYGAIQRIFANGNYLMIFQENKVGNVPVLRRVIDTADGGTSLALSNQILNGINYYKGDYGLTKPESFADYDGDFFGWDIKKAKVWELNLNGFQMVSDLKVQSHFEEESRKLLPFYRNSLLPLGIDRELDLVYVSTLTQATGDKLEDPSANPTQETFGKVSQTTTTVDVPLEPLKVEDAPNASLAVLTPALADLNAPLSSLGGAVQNLNAIAQTGQFAYIGEIETTGSQFVLVDANFSGTTRQIEAEYDFDEEALKLPINDTIIAPNTTITYNGFTLGYNKKNNAWISFFSFIPEMYGHVHESSYAFNDGKVYQLNNNNTRCNFFDTQFNSIFEVDFNTSPSEVKLYDALLIEGNTGDFSVTLETDLTSTTMSNFVKKESFFRGSIPRSTSSVSGYSSLIGLGTIDETEAVTIEPSGSPVAATIVTIGGANFYELGLIPAADERAGSKQRTGDIVLVAGVSIGELYSIDDVDTITVIGSAVTTSTFAYVAKDAVFNGDRMRGYHCRARFTNSETTFVEVFAVNAQVKQSLLHNS